MAEVFDIGEIVIDRLRKGAKVTINLFRPGSDRPETLEAPDHFATVEAARRFAGVAHRALRIPIRDNTESGA